MTVPAMRRKLRGVLFPGSRRRRRPIISKPHERGASSSDFDQGTENQREEEKDEHLLEEPNSPSIPADWVITIKEKLDQAPPSRNSWLSHSILRVPTNLQEIEPKAYVPQIVSFGPFHHGKTHLKAMEKHKWRLLRHLLERKGHHVESYLEAMMKLEEKTRLCYSERIKHIKSPEFVEMMLLDACFILELMNTSVKGFIYCGYSWGDPIFTSRGVLPCIQRDMLMLENQLPLFVLDQLWTLTCDPSESDSVSELTLQFFDSVIPGCKILQPGVVNSDEPGLHLLHVVRQCLLPSFKSTFSRVVLELESKPQSQLMMHCVTVLRDSGVRFRKKKSEKFMDIEFKNGVLSIPPLIIHDSTKSIFLNLMAFEQCYPLCSNHVTSYMGFMNGLIDSSRDVGYLRYKGIIDHGLGSEEEVACLFNKICREFAFDINDCYLSEVSAEVNRYFDRKWHTWKASLKHDYFNNPWAIVSLIAAILLIGLTLIQAVYTVLAYHIPSS